MTEKPVLDSVAGVTASTCKRCGGEIHYIEYTAWNGMDHDVLDAWWSHTNHPADGHEGVPA